MVSLSHTTVGKGLLSQKSSKIRINRSSSFGFHGRFDGIVQKHAPAMLAVAPPFYGLAVGQIAPLRAVCFPGFCPHLPDLVMSTCRSQVC